MNRMLPEATTNEKPHVARRVCVLLGGSILPHFRMDFDTGKYASVVNKQACDHYHEREATAQKCLRTRLTAHKAGN